MTDQVPYEPTVAEQLRAQIAELQRQIAQLQRERDECLDRAIEAEAAFAQRLREATTYRLADRDASVKGGS